MKKLILILPVLALMSFANRVGPVFMPQPKGFVYIPTGTTHIGGKQISNHAFWMSSTEVTNEEYQAYLDAVSIESPPIKAIYGRPDTNVINHQLWISKYHSYFEDPLFAKFPVVGLDRVMMEDYAEWLSAELKKKHPEWEFNFRLPTKHEWQFAAMGGRDNNKFPWGGPFVRNSKGCVLMHYFDLDQRFAVYGEDAPLAMTFDKEMPDTLSKAEYDKILQSTKNLKKTKRKHFGKSLPLIGLPVPADSYFPNDFGLFNMSGNVAELTSDNEAVGGSFKTTSEYCKIKDATAYPFDASKPQPDLGFRLVCSYEGVSYDKNGNKIKLEDAK